MFNSLKCVCNMESAGGQGMRERSQGLHDHGVNR